MKKYVVTRAEIDELEGVERAHFLNENVLRRVKSLSDLTALEGIGVHIVELPPGRPSTEFHFHHFEEECIYILEGERCSRLPESGQASVDQRR